MLRRVAATDAEVLFSGPSGVGKELYARYLHEQSHREPNAFVAVNCGALPIDLFENELFGHVTGAFTGARPRSEGLVTAAEGGTLFLDEVDTLAVPCQVKLLRFVQEKEFRRLGEVRVRKANVRIVAASNANLEAKVAEGSFRADLFFRLRVVPVRIPELHERSDDIPRLIDAFSQRYAAAYGVAALELTRAAWQKMCTYSWPGNVRELENCVRYLTCLNLGRAADLRDLPLLEGEALDGAPGRSLPSPQALVSQPFHAAKQTLITRFEQAYLRAALERSGGNIARAARVSGKHRRAFFELMRKHGIRTGESEDQPASS